MSACARLLLLAALPALAGIAGGEVVSVTEGAGPAFAPRQSLALVAAVGQQATLECCVLRLADKAVSWVRSRDLQILTHAGAVFTADARVSAAESGAGAGGAGVTGAGVAGAAGAGGAGAAGAGGAGTAGAGGTGAAVTRHSLRIERLRLADSGRYECQVNTEPKMSLFFNLTVLDEPVPVVVVSAVGEQVVRARAGGAGTLACEARYSPAPRALPVAPLDVRWRRGTDLLSLQEGTVVPQSGRGGVSLDTERWAARVVSRLTLADLRAEDAGQYSCTAAGVSATLRLLLDHQEERMEMQRDQAGNGAAGGRARLLAAVSLLTALYSL